MLSLVGLGRSAINFVVSFRKVNEETNAESRDSIVICALHSDSSQCVTARDPQIVQDHVNLME